jgi:hypothetical protein
MFIACITETDSCGPLLMQVGRLHETSVDIRIMVLGPVGNYRSFDSTDSVIGRHCSMLRMTPSVALVPLLY